MKMFYFNDEQKKVAVYIHTLEGPPTILQPSTGQIFDVPVPEKCTLFVKKWQGYVLLSWMDNMGMNID